MKILSRAVTTLLLSALSSAPAIAGTLINRAQGTQLSSTCLSHDQSNTCVKLEVRADLTSGVETIVLERQALDPNSYPGNTPSFIYYTLEFPFMILKATESVAITVYTAPVSMPAGFVVDVMRSPVVVTKKIIDQRKINLIAFLFDTEIEKSKTVSTKAFYGVVSALGMNQGA